MEPAHPVARHHDRQTLPHRRLDDAGRLRLEKMGVLPDPVVSSPPQEGSKNAASTVADIRTIIDLSLVTRNPTAKFQRRNLTSYS